MPEHQFGHLAALAAGKPPTPPPPTDTTPPMAVSVGWHAFSLSWNKPTIVPFTLELVAEVLATVAVAEREHFRWVLPRAQWELLEELAPPCYDATTDPPTLHGLPVEASAQVDRLHLVPYC